MRAATDLAALVGEHVPLRPRGREHVGLCPFHDDHTPSFCVVTHKGNAFYKCHACGAAGDAFRFVMDYHQMSFGEALRFLAERAGVRLRPAAAAARRPGSIDAESIREANAAAAAFFRATLARSGPDAPCRELVRSRRFSDETVAAWGLGAAPAEWDGLLRYARGRGLRPETLAAAGLLKPRSGGDGHYDTFRNRLVFPIGDELGRPVAFGGRRIDPADEPKYLNSPESPVFSKARTLYGLHLARRAVIESRRALVVEGYTDVIACHQAGLANVVATMGTALTRDHARVLKRLCDVVVLVFDGDEAGQAAADRAVEVFFAEPIDVKICVLPEGKDPADLLAGPEGRPVLDAALDGAVDALAFKVCRFREHFEQAGGLSARQRVLEELLAGLSALGFAAMPGVRRRPVTMQLAGMLGLLPEDIERALPRPRNAPLRADRTGPAAAAGEPPPAAADCPPARRRAERELLGLLVSRPALRAIPVGLGAEGAPVAGVLSPEQFRDPAAQEIAAAVFPLLAAGAEFSVQDLMAGMEQPSLRALLADLYLEAQRPVDDEAGAFREAAEALLRLLDRERYQKDVEAYRRRSPDAPSTSDATGEGLRRLVEDRRSQGYIPAAMPARVRT